MQAKLALLLLASLLLGGCGRNAEDIQAVGTLEWTRIEVAAQLAEPISAWEAPEGQPVAAGQALLRLDARRQQARVDAAQAARAQAAARLAELERGTRSERIAQARARLTGSERQLDFQQRELARVEALLTRKLIAPDRVDQTRTARDAATAERDAARATLDELQQGATTEEREQVRQALAAADAELAAARLDLEHTRVVAPVAGRLDELPFKVGERPPVGGVVAVILTGARPYARVYVPETIRARLHPGSTATISVDGIDTPFTGTLRKISADPSFTPYFALTEHDRGRLSFVAEIDVDVDTDTGHQELPAGVPAQARFALDDTQN
ncbi:MAG: HlyD family efflux transporter periplasmic adaptor subunit [Gammaproteobacteria bacterium]|nr:HlyD family efflux transporter periplasmic adaptor subunit [Gammaproteobacteria bacterium]